MGAYESAAKKAKKAFIRRLRTCPSVAKGDGEPRGHLIAQLVGVSPPTVSRFLSDPSRVSERFIREVACNIPGMEDAYAEYRVAVDAEYVPADLYVAAVTCQEVRTDVREVVAKVEAAMDAARDAAVRSIRDSMTKKTGKATQ